MEVTAFSRAHQWQPVILSHPQDELRLHSLDFKLPLNVLYEGLGK